MNLIYEESQKCHGWNQNGNKLDFLATSHSFHAWAKLDEMQFLGIFQIFVETNRRKWRFLIFHKATIRNRRLSYQATFRNAAFFDIDQLKGSRSNKQNGIRAEKN